jgi:hypothetical protein
MLTHIYYTQNLEITREKAEERGQEADPEATVERFQYDTDDRNMTFIVSNKNTGWHTQAYNQPILSYSPANQPHGKLQVDSFPIPPPLFLWPKI